MRMARVNITIPDSLYDAAKATGLNVSRLAQAAVAAELTRWARVGELKNYLAELESELGPVPPAERAAAEKWADGAIKQ